MVEDRDVDFDVLLEAGRSDPAPCAEVRATDPLYILYTSGTTGKPKGIVRDNGGHAVALAWSMSNIYDVRAGQVWWTASDVGWVVGHSYIVYAPADRRRHDDPLRGQAGRHAGRRRLLAGDRRPRCRGPVHRADRDPRDQEGGPRGRAHRAARPVVAAPPLPGRRAARPRDLPLGVRAPRHPGDRPLVADRDGLADRRQPARARADADQGRLADRPGAGVRRGRPRREGRAGRGRAPRARSASACRCRRARCRRSGRTTIGSSRPT